MALGLALQSNLAVELGLNDNQVGLLNLWSTIIGAAGCVAGGFLSDRFGRKKMLRSTSSGWRRRRSTDDGPPQHHWIMPVDPNLPPLSFRARDGLWIATLVYSLFNGLMYGTRTALFMTSRPPRSPPRSSPPTWRSSTLISYSSTWRGGHRGDRVSEDSPDRFVLRDRIGRAPAADDAIRLKLRREEPRRPPRGTVMATSGPRDGPLHHRSVLCRPRRRSAGFSAPVTKPLAPLLGPFFTITTWFPGSPGGQRHGPREPAARLDIAGRGILTILTYPIASTPRRSDLPRPRHGGRLGRPHRGYLLAIRTRRILLFSIVAGARLLVALPEEQPGSGPDDVPTEDTAPEPAV